MMLNSYNSFITKAEHKFRFFLTVMGSLALCFLMLLTVLDVFGRYLLNSPISGATELTEMSIAILVFSVLPIITWQDKQVVVDIFEGWLTPTYLKIQATIAAIVGVVGYLFIGYRILEFAQRSARRNEISEYLEIPLSIIQNFVGVMCMVCALGLLLVLIIPNLISLINQGE